MNDKAYAKALARGFLATLRLVPDEIILETAARELDLSDGDACLCGWFARELIGRRVGLDGGDVDVSYTPVVRTCEEGFGGTYREWSDLFQGVCSTETLVAATEFAFAERVAEAASR